MGLDADTGGQLIEKAKEKEREDQIRAQWVAQLPVMAFTGVPVGFKDYMDQVTGANIDTRPTAVILAELDETEERLRCMQDGNGNI